MLFSRILGGIGRTMISAGVLILLFVVYQLWGTGIRTSAAQGTLRDRFAQQQARAGTVPDAASTTAPSTSTPSASGATTTPGSTAAPSAADPAGFVAPKPGEPIGRIEIPAIGADFVMVEGVDLRWLAEGPGHFPGTPLPGQPGNAAIAGHRTTYLAPFNRLDEVKPDDHITITTVQGTFTYQVEGQPGPNAGEQVGYRIILPTQTEILDQVPGQNTLTLMACHPKFNLTQRIVVVAKLVGNPAAATAASAESKRAAQQPTDDALLGGGGTADLVGGDSSASTSAIAYSLLAALIWFVTWFVARRWPSWKQWPRFAMFAGGAVLFAVPLFLAFERINQLLPAGY